MKIIVGTNNAEVRSQASRWIANIDRVILEQLSNWARNLEPDYGECYIFLEVSVPKQHKHQKNQIDLIIAFNTICIVCELKRHRSVKTLKVEDLVDQINDQARVMAKLTDKTVRQLCFLPYLSEPDLEIVDRSLAHIHSRQDIRVAGSSISNPSGQRSFLQILSKLLPPKSSVSFGNSPGAQHQLLSKVSQQGRKPDIYPSVHRALTALASYNRCSHLPLPDTHVDNLRTDSLLACQRIYDSFGYLVVQGGPGSGKSTVITELLRSRESPVTDLHVPSSLHSLSHLVELIEIRHNGYVAPSLSDDERIEWLAGLTGSIWIKTFPPGLHSLVWDLRVALEKFSDSLRMKFVFEVCGAVPRMEECTVSLPPLCGDDLFKIICAHSDFDASFSIEEVIRVCNGNPGIAIACCKSGTLSSTYRSNGPESLAILAVNSIERAILENIVVAWHWSPLGVSKEVLTAFCLATCDSWPKSSVLSTLETLYDRMQRQQLLAVSYFSAEVLPPGLKGIVSDDVELEYITQIDSGLASALMNDRSLKDEVAIELLTSSYELLAKTSQTSSYADVSYWLLLGEAEPFFRSTFRYSSLRLVISDWLNRTDIRPSRGDQAYFFRVMRGLASLHEDNVSQVLDDVGSPELGRSSQEFASSFLKARSMFGQNEHNEITLELEPLLSRDVDLWAAFVTSTATRIRRSGQEADALDYLLVQLAQETRRSDSSRAMVLHCILTSLNRKEGRERIGPETARVMISKFVCELSEIAIRVGDLQLLSEALFFEVRSVEFAQARISQDDILCYLNVLTWMDSVDRSVGRWHMRKLLTRGSIHRHYLRKEGIEWEDTIHHARSAIGSYTRVFHLALRTRSATQCLNSLTYCTQLIRSCTKSTRVDRGLSQGVIGLLKVTRTLQEEWLRVDIPIKGNDKRLEHNAICGIMLCMTLDFVLSGAGGFDDISNCAEDFVRRVKSVRREELRVKYGLFDMLKDIRRFNRFLCAVEEPASGHWERLSQARSLLESILTNTKPLNEGTELSREWEKCFGEVTRSTAR